MTPGEWSALRRWLACLGTIVVLRALVEIVAGYGAYLPAPDFRADFLVGREATFFRGGYSEAFVVHLLAGPAAILLGLALASGSLRRRAPVWHRRLGWTEAVIVLLGVVPSGLMMACRPAPTLPFAERLVAGLGFATLALATGAAALAGLLAARRRRFDRHGHWMARLLALLGSAVILRLMGGAAEVFLPNVPWTYPVSAWASWLLPLFVVDRLAPARERGAVTRPIPAANPPRG